MSNSMGPDQTKQLSSLIWVQTICESSSQIPVSYNQIQIICKTQPQLPVSYILMSNSMGPDLTKWLSSLIRVQTICKKKKITNLLSVICQLYHYVKQYGSRSDLTIVKTDLGPNYLQKFTSFSFQLYPYVKQ